MIRGVKGSGGVEEEGGEAWEWEWRRRGTCDVQGKVEHGNMVCLGGDRVKAVQKSKEAQ